MKQQWTSEELLASWMLTDTEKAFINSRYTDTNKVGFGTLFKCFQQDGRFPQRKQDIPGQIVIHIAQQLALQPKEFHSYGWTGGTIDRHRARIRSFLGFRICSAQDVVEITQWLSAQELLGDERQPDRLKDVVYARFRDRKIEPPEPKSVDRLIRSALRRADEQFYRVTTRKLSPETRENLDALLDPATHVDGTAATYSVLQDLRNEAGSSGLESVFAEIAKLQHIRSLGLPADLFSHTSRKVVAWYRARVGVEDLAEIRRHPGHIRYVSARSWTYSESRRDRRDLAPLEPPSGAPEGGPNGGCRDRGAGRTAAEMVG